MSTDIHKTSSNDISSVWKDIDRASPVIPDGFVNELMQRRYGMHVLETKELDSYVDRNIHVIVDQNITNKFVSDFHHHGYILKILETDTDLVGKIYIYCCRIYNNCVSIYYYVFLCPIRRIA